MTLSLCMIAKNESQFIQDSLASVRDICDEMIVVDTGSHDTTPDLAQAMGAQVHHFDWCDDFSAARNFSLSKASSEWILVLDADEKLDTHTANQILELIQSSNIDIFSLRQLTYSNSSNYLDWQAVPEKMKYSLSYSGYIESRLYRLFRNRRDISYQGLVHEQLCSRNTNYRFCHSDLVIHHYSEKISDTDCQNKYKLYLKLGQEKCEQNPRSFMAFYEMGVQYLNLSMPSAAKPYFEKALLLESKSIKTLMALVYVAEYEKEYQQALKYLNMIQTLDAINPMLFAHYIDVYMSLEKYGLAEKYFRMAQDLSITSSALLIQSAVLCLRTQKYDLAIKLFSQAIEINPNDSLAKFNMGLCYLKTNDLAQAQKFFSEIPKSSEHFMGQYRALSEYYFANRNLEKTQSYIQKLLDYDSNDCEANYQMGILLLQSNKSHEAAQHLSRIDSYNKFNQQQLRHLMQCYMSLKDYTHANAVKLEIFKNKKGGTHGIHT